jgi:hypothetical protein
MLRTPKTPFCDEHWEVAFSIVGMNMHVPQGRNQELSMGIQNLRSARNLHPLVKADLDDLVFRD